MSDLIEGMGTASEGGLFARVLEPESGAKPPHPDQPEACLNCGAGLVGAYCHACGQKARIHRSIGAFMHDLLHGALHFEGKLWRTLPVLVLRPGILTRRYIEGARARFVSPMALFLFSVFLMFAIFQAIGLTTPEEIGGERAVAGKIVDSRDLWESEVQAMQARLDTTAPGDPSRAALEEELVVARANLAELDEISRLALAPDGEDGLNIRTGVDFLDNTIIEKWREHPGLMLYKMQANAYKFSWLLIPLSVPFVWLLFVWKRRYKGYDHAIFVTYSISFVTLLAIVLSLLGRGGAGIGTLALAAMAIIPLHLYRQLRGAYELTRFSALWRLVALLAFEAIILVLFLQLLLLLGAF